MTSLSETCELYQGDFFLAWQKVPTGSVDLAICDPPYNILQAVHAWDKKIDFAVLSWILSLLLTPCGQIAVFCISRMIPEVVSEFSKYFENRYIEVWQKPSATALHKDRPKPDVEFVCVFHRRGTKKADHIYNWQDVAIQGEPYERVNRTLEHTCRKTQKREIDINSSGRRYPSSVVYFPNRPAMMKEEKRSANHPAQKSLVHMGQLIRLLSNEGQTVLDPFTGSGTAILAALNTGRKAIGFEIEPEYYTMTQIRLRRETAQGSLVLTGGT